MPTSPVAPKKSPLTRVKKTVAKKRPPVPGKRAAKKVASGVTDSVVVPAQDQGGGRAAAPRQIEQLALVSFALLFALTGLAVHVLWFVSIVMMAIQLGLMASEFGNRRGSKGILSEVTHEVVTIVEEIKSGASDRDTTADAADPESATTA
jgi:Flp pilus assembly protein TadB